VKIESSTITRVAHLSYTKRTTLNFLSLISLGSRVVLLVAIIIFMFSSSYDVSFDRPVVE